MKKKGLIIGIISIVLVVAIILLIVLLPNKNNSKKEENKPTNIELKAKRSFEGFDFVNAKMKELEEGKYAIDVTVTNKSAKKEPTRVIITYYGENKKELGAAICMIPPMDVEKTLDLQCSSNVKEILKAVDYKVVKTDKEIGE